MRPTAVRIHPDRLGRAAALAALFLAAVAAGHPAAAAYILYHHTFGEWSVVCWQGMAVPESSCFIDAPAIALEEAGRMSAIRITGPGPGGYTLTVSSRSGTALGTRVILSVDNNPAYERGPDHLDRVTWTGPEAVAIIEELERGRALALRFLGAPAAARELSISLEEFGAAFEAFRDGLARLGERGGGVSGGSPARGPAGTSADRLGK
ncbi:MAG: hypothetical protein V3U18_01780 [Alphaproteobacteria bacterium]